MRQSNNQAGAHLSLDISRAAKDDCDSVTRSNGIAPHLDASDVAELAAAIKRSLRDSEAHASSQSDIEVDLRHALRVSCAKARLQRVRAEQLLVDLKNVWMSLPTVPSTRNDERLNRIVSACIDEYYACETPLI